ncbi:hypothetical protein ATCVTN60342_389L [Acanthocystis turfacea Chlorella virus TN603.4.2]|nr:hypothetical protein ATCVTN60342_389L [Acanthocystis turfacea Chlorella virus TN603.4.2]
MTDIMSNPNDTREVERVKANPKLLKAEIERLKAENECLRADIELARQITVVLRYIDAELERPAPIPKSCAMSARFF